MIELLVVVAIIAILMAILMPTLNRAREQGRRAVCLNYIKTLTLGWSMYADENDDRIVNGEAYTPTTDEFKADLQKMQEAIRGRLGY